MNIQGVIDTAKKTIMEQGEHAPMLLAEDFKGGTIMMYFADLPETTREKQAMFFGLGRKYGIAHPGNPVAHLYFISEAWASFVPVGQQFKYNAPSEDPNKKEILLILHLDVAREQTEAHRFEMIRNGYGRLYRHS